MSQLFNICLSNACCKSDALLRTIFSFNNYLLSAYSVPGTVLGPGIKQWTKLQSTRLHGPVKERTNKPKIVSMSRMMHALRKSREQTVWVLGLLASGLDSPLRTGGWVPPPAGRAPASKSPSEERHWEPWAKEEKPPRAVGAVSPDSALPQPRWCLLPAGDVGGFPPPLRGDKDWRLPVFVAPGLLVSSGFAAITQGTNFLR